MASLGVTRTKRYANTRVTMPRRLVGSFAGWTARRLPLLEIWPAAVVLIRRDPRSRRINLAPHCTGIADQESLAHGQLLDADPRPSRVDPASTVRARSAAEEEAVERRP